MSKDKELTLQYDGKWVKVKTVKYPGQSEIEFSTERVPYRVVVLPFRPHGLQLYKEYLLRDEIIPPWSKHPHTTAITGCGEEDMTPEDVALMELEQEAGYKARLSNLISLGFVYPTKPTDVRAYMFAVDVSKCEQVEVKGDGTLMETLGKCEWYHPHELRKTQDALLLVAYHKLGELL